MALGLLMLGLASCTSNPEKQPASPSTSATTESEGAVPIAESPGTAPTCPGASSRSLGPLGWAIGDNSVAVVGFAEESAIIKIGNGRQTPFGWSVKVLVLVHKGEDLPTSLSAVESESGTPAYIQSDPDDEPRTDVHLMKPQIPPARGWLQFPSHLFVPAEGCYEMTARWDGGSWSRVFSVGA